MERENIKNEVLDKLPPHLLDLVIDQPYDNYTAQDHAVWRYVMRQNINFLGKVAHSSYLNGLKKTGISIDSIPHMYGMNRILKEIGWAAVAVDGFIPPQAFMEFQAYNVLVIAADIRNINHILYTPAPDIIHESAGHAPIIADEEYASYLRLFGEIGSKAFSSKQDYELYEAIRHLSIIKEDPGTPEDEVRLAEKAIEEIQANMGEPSEMAKIRNLHWWTVEYGLIGTVDDFKLYGAGLLSSIGESANCIKPSVKKLPYTIDAVNYSFDITTQQPQLFVTPSFAHLSDVLNAFADSMAFRKGGTRALETARNSGHHATVELSSGIQVGGVVDRVWQDDQGEAIYFATAGPTQLCFENQELDGQGKIQHAHGFSSPLGRLEKSDRPLEHMSIEQLAELGIIEGNHCELRFSSGIALSGILTQITTLPNGLKGILTFDQCTVRLGNQILFDPSWGIYDMVLGAQVASCAAGLPDPRSFGLTFEAPKEKTHKIEYSESDKNLHQLYKRVRQIREQGLGYDELEEIFDQLQSKFPHDWLLALEILEILRSEELHDGLAKVAEQYLTTKALNNEELNKLIHDGIRLIDADFELVHP
ncbi:MAG TPA: aromatic amino acid hydroxylase [Luteibaculaceae bacterium]|nr:aromatic amino acid hydroxylase [Luteibaculaceae bacterium]